ncbi:MAG: insulinase family protein [Deltaproteobacteria bacterium]|nr:insulinase family protein [Deltaproteobacteria bacterium]
MRRTGLAAVLLLAGACATARAPLLAEPDRARVPPLGPPPALRLPPQVRFQLENGLKVRLVEYHRLPIVALQLLVDAGGVHDPEARPGLASFTAGMMTEGTRGRSATQISDALGAIGAHLGSGAGFDGAQLSAQALSTHLDPLLELFADVLQRPAFPPEDFARVKDQRLVALVQQRDQPGAIAGRAFAPLFWGSHPYGHALSGTEESLRAVTREELAAFHAARWRPGGAELIVVGDVTRAELEPRLRKALGGWTGAAPAPLAAAPPRQAAARTVAIDKKGAPQAYLLLGMPGFPRSDPDHAAAQVAFEILGGGTASRLFRLLREEKGYTYGISARPESRRLGGAAVVGGSVKADQAGEALAALLGELSRMRDQPPSEEELAGARQGIVLSLPGDFATAGGIAGHLAEAALYGLPDDHYTRLAGQIAAVSAADVQRAAGRWLDTGKLTAVLVCDTAQVVPQLGGLPLGPLELRPAPAAAGGR